MNGRPCHSPGESLGDARVAPEARREKLDGHVAVERMVVREHDLCGRAPAEETDRPVAGWQRRVHRASLAPPGTE